MIGDKPPRDGDIFSRNIEASLRSKQRSPCHTVLQFRIVAKVRTIFTIFFRETRRMRRISRIHRESENRRVREVWVAEGGGLGVEWLAVSGFGFHGSKPSLLYYGQPLTTNRTQRFASRTSMRVTDHARLFSACPGNADIPICRKYFAS